MILDEINRLFEEVEAVYNSDMGDRTKWEIIMKLKKKLSEIGVVVDEPNSSGYEEEVHQYYRDLRLELGR